MSVGFVVDKRHGASTADSLVSVGTTRAPSSSSYCPAGIQWLHSGPYLPTDHGRKTTKHQSSCDYITARFMLQVLLFSSYASVPALQSLCPRSYASRPILQVLWFSSFALVPKLQFLCFSFYPSVHMFQPLWLTRHFDSFLYNLQIILSLVFQAVFKECFQFVVFPFFSITISGVIRDMSEDAEPDFVNCRTSSGCTLIPQYRKRRMTVHIYPYLCCR